MIGVCVLPVPSRVGPIYCIVVFFRVDGVAAERNKGTKEQPPPEAAAKGTKEHPPPEAAAKGTKEHPPPEAAAKGSKEQPPEAVAKGSKGHPPPKACQRIKNATVVTSVLVHGIAKHQSQGTNQLSVIHGRRRGLAKSLRFTNSRL